MDIVLWKTLTYVFIRGMESTASATPMTTSVDRSRDVPRAFLIVLLILTVVQTQAEKQCGKPTPPQCKDDCTNKIWFHVTNSTTGIGTCQQCLDCPPGYQLDRACGGEEGLEAICVPVCFPGEFFDMDQSRCIPCRHCDNTIGDIACSATSDGKCGPCRQGYFHEQGKPDLCHHCSLLTETEQDSKPQCQTSRISTEPPLTVTTSESPSARHEDTPAMVRTTAVSTTTPDSHGTGHMMASSNRAGQTSLPDSTTSSNIELPNDNIFQNEPSAEETDGKEASQDGPFSPQSSSVLVVCLLTLFLLVLLIGGFGWVTVKRSRRVAQRQQEQRRSFRQFVQRNWIDDGSQHDPDSEDEKVFVDCENGTAQYWDLAPRCPVSSSLLNGGLEASSFSSVSSVFAAQRNNSDLTDQTSGRSLNYSLLEEQIQTMYRLESCDWKCHDEDDMVYIKPIQDTEKSMPLRSYERPLKVLNHEENGASEATHLLAGDSDGVTDPNAPASLQSFDGTHSLLSITKRSKDQKGKKSRGLQAKEGSAGGRLSKAFVNAGVQCHDTAFKAGKDEVCNGNSERNDEEDGMTAVQEAGDGVSQAVQTGQQQVKISTADFKTNGNGTRMAAEQEATVCKVQAVQTDFQQASAAIAKRSEDAAEQEATVCKVQAVQTDFQQASAAIAERSKDATGMATELEATVCKPQEVQTDLQQAVDGKRNGEKHQSKEATPRTSVTAAVVGLEQEATICKPEATQTEAHEGVSDITASGAGQVKEDSNGFGNPVEPEATAFKGLETQAEPDGSIPPPVSTTISSTDDKARSAGSPHTKQKPSKKGKFIKPAPPSINVNCEGSKNQISVNYSVHYHQNDSYSPSETETDSE
ncbi:uncharacterized protein LOC110987427 [Acanthaster planci]|uniref:Uncharacterized protein LOC110987427 n=1 Tax=Acanthaster planci TaxID=133434 RepID=A0A8B7ZLC4_ACAPL|nr:uncharacterized protein LOC110987427 [Acanthaster planci]